MFKINDDLSIYVTRGDTVFFLVTAEENGEDYVFKAGDVLRFKVYGKKNAENVVLQKDFPVASETQAVYITLTEADTKIGEVISKPVDYWYEVELNPFTSPQTIIGYDDEGAKIFKLHPEGDDIPEFEPDPEDVRVIDTELDMTSTRPVQNQAIARAMATLKGDFAKTRDMAASAENAVEVERARINNLAALEEGSTTGDAELIDIRVATDGVIHATAGEAVRNQFTNVYERLNHVFESLCQPVKTVEYDKGITSTGEIYSKEGWVLKTVELTGGENYYFSTLNDARNHTAFYDASGSFICFYTDLGNYETVVTTPENAVYVKYVSTHENDFVIAEDIYKAYGLKPYALSELVQIPESDATELLHRLLYVNMLNPKEIELGCYYSHLTGAKKENTEYYSTGFIRIAEGQTLAVFNPDMSTREIRMVCYYNKGKCFLGGNQYISQYTQTGDVAYVRFAIETDAPDVMVADIATEKYLSYSDGGIIKGGLLPTNQTAEVTTSYNGSVRATTAVDSLSANTLLTVSEFPHYIKNGLGITFSARFDTFAGVKIGKGYQAYRGNWLEITADKIISKQYESAEEEIGSVAHGLTISEFIQICIDVQGYDCVVTINTLGGSFTHTFEWPCEQCGELFATASQNMTSVKLSAVCKQLRSPCWLFGDSYFGVNSSRICGHLKEIGYFDNLLIVGLAGMKSTNALADLKRCFAFSTPKFLVWYLGMNDSADNYSAVLKAVKELCEGKNITLILNKVPCTPTMDKTEIDTIVTESGLRYIDSASAVGVDANNEWYAGYLSSDNVHPNPIGAKALAMQLLVDVPEIMQY